MLLTITTTHEPATDLGFLLHKHPDRAQAFPVSAGNAHVFYPEAGPRRCTAALLVELDPVALVRGRAGGLSQYVNDRPYAAGSQLAVALRTVFGTALAGRCAARPELVDTPIPLEIAVPSLSAGGGADLVERLFAPLGWRVEATPVPLDEQVPGWGDSRYLSLRLRGQSRLATALSHLYVLLPVLDRGKHYWVGEDEVDKLLRAGEGWLAGHPERELISRRYLAHSRPLVDAALSQLAESDDTPPEELDDALAEPAVTAAPEAAEPLAVQRQGSVLAALRAADARRVLDLGCGSGMLLRLLLREPSFTEIVGVDVSTAALRAAERRLRLDRLPEAARARITLRQSALTYVDPALAGYDAAVLMEVIEHVDEQRLPALEHVVFAAAHPRTVVVTTPNAEYNVRFDNLAAGEFRHADHRFEWPRSRFREWADGVATRHGYRVRILPVGAEDPEVGPPTQLAVFTAEGGAA
ncbi:3' terminal RNA ribose 2'-O-methyltransferase Hen1 [Amycolatopsis aidingensis]|uniref:3' terminal RNA ribose 2'-O-methyltransferase Hen1 n=1 Tax=Amycolatopsis aidingensis TaxID=2842453 RepID=UPI001C0D75A9|nr:3' terminal RNA ribose 2'-O-methyltransferase Hen1 [Amycolatopsis aidingensis]